MKKVAQLVHTLSYGDAISTEVLTLHTVFSDLGYESEIYAINEHPKLKGKSKKYTELKADFAGEVILHYSLGSPLNNLYAELSKATRSLIYHNLTPPEWFEKVNPRIVRDIRQGLEELPNLLLITDRVIADSSFNASELIKYNVHAEVLELPFDPQRWVEPANAGIAAQLKSDPVVHLVHIGRLAPNKKVEDIIKTAYVLREVLKTPCRIWISGIDIDTELYSFGLKRLVNFLGLEKETRFVGCFADSELRALYENGTVYMCLSEHEGYCLPVVEAMHFALPVIAYNGSALKDTVGNGGVLVDEKNYLELALIVKQIAEDKELRMKLIEAGKARVAGLSVQNFAARVKEIFSVLVKNR